MRISFLLFVFLIIGSSLFAQKSPSPSYKISCPPIDKTELAGMFVPVISGSTYRLQFTPTEGFKSRMQGYTNLLYTFYPGMESFSQKWQLFDAGEGKLPFTTSIANIVPRAAGASTDLTTELNMNSKGEISTGADLFPQRLLFDKWYTIKVLLSTSEGKGKPSRITKECESIVLSYNVKAIDGVTVVSISDEKKIIKEYSMLPDRCMDFNDRSQHTLSNWKQNGNVLSITYDVEPTEHQFYLKFIDDDKESIVFNNVDYSGNWLTKYGSQCVCFDYRIKYNPFVEPGNDYTPVLYLYAGNKTLENSGNSWNSGLISAKFVGSYTNVNNVWKHYCFPIGLCQGRLPYNEYGRWKIDRADSCAVWDSIITHVAGLIIPTDYNRAPSEEISFDNFCTTKCPDAPRTYTVSCPPITKSDLAAMISPVAMSAVNGSYRLQFSPATTSNNKMQSYTDYLYSYYPLLQAFSQSWQVFDAGTGSSPSLNAEDMGGKPYLVSYTPYSGGNISMNPAGFSQVMQPDRWYTIKVDFSTVEKDATSRIPIDCSTMTFSYRVQMVNGIRKIMVE
jgi:hypothetical protein